ncbi:MAG TPA: CpsD/CapB family tyrosine-protein kinase [Candidatus Acidoferrales bacterium]|nr:CpsD/CapB family tyrosine-protein kinase [Candidatus Acidoferrales bacterium]
MSRLYDTLRKMDREKRLPGTVAPEPDQPFEVLNNIEPGPVETKYGPAVRIKPGRTSRLVALTDPKSLGAEKFRALAARLENLRQKSELKTLQITSAVVNEGKSLVAANLAVTIVKHFGYKTLLVEGDMHRPTLSTLLGLTGLEGINQWWCRREEDQEIAHYIHRLGDMSLWFLSAGSACDQPSELLQSARFAETFMLLVGGFDWVIIDSTPMSPVVDANLWSRLVDGTLLVVREGVAPIKALKMGVKDLDNPKWLGIVLNEASEFDRVNYTDQYYGVQKKAENRP